MSFQPPNLTPEGKAEMAAIIREAIKDKRAIAIARVQIIVMARAELTTESGRVINEPSVELCCGIEVSLEGRARKGNVAIVRVNGLVVLHAFSGEYVPGEWEAVLAHAVQEIEDARVFADVPDLHQDIKSDREMLRKAA